MLSMLPERATKPNAAVSKPAPSLRRTPAGNAAGATMAYRSAMGSRPPAAPGYWRGGGDREKNPTDPTVALPAAITDSKTLSKGVMKWKLQAASHVQAQCDVEFLPDRTKVDARNVSYLQTVLGSYGTNRAYPGASSIDPIGKKAEYEKFEESTEHRRIDHFADAENDPFYGAEWDQGAQKWKKERADWDIGNTTDDPAKPARMGDAPSKNAAREGHGDVKVEFETVPTVLETGETLGALKWGFKIADQENAPIELTGGTQADCTDTPSTSVNDALARFFESKFETILDDFDIAKHDLKPDHKTKLDDVATRMTANPSLKAQLGGAADHTGEAAFNMDLSLKRANAAKAYLESKGISDTRIEVQSYGFDWARVAAGKGVSEGKNRRVQVWLH